MMQFVQRDFVIRVDRVSSEMDFRDRIRKFPGQVSMIVGELAEELQEMCTIRITTRTTEAILGVRSEGLSLQMVLHPSSLVLGVNSDVIFYDCITHRVVATGQLPGLFRSLEDLPDRGLVLAAHELGLVAFTSDGQELWRYGQDVLKDYTLNGEDVTLVFMDEPPVRLHLHTGHLIPE